MGKRMDMEHLFGIKINIMKVIGIEGNNMEMEYIKRMV